LTNYLVYITILAQITEYSNNKT